MTIPTQLSLYGFVATAPQLNRTGVIVLAHDLQIPVADAATGELPRDLTLDPTKRYQGTPDDHPAPAGGTTEGRTHDYGFGPPRCPETSHS